MAEQPPAEPRFDIIGNVPFDIQLAILRRISPKWIFRMRRVCRAWRDMVSQGALHGLAPPQMLLCFGREACPDRYLQLNDYCVESFDLSSGKLRHVFRFCDHEYHDMVADLEDRDADAPPIEDLFVDYRWMEECYDKLEVKPQIIVHGSLNGYLLVSFLRSWYVINPATRQWAFVPDLSPYGVIGFYQHATSGEYRVLFMDSFWSQEVEEAYYSYVEFQGGDVSQYAVLTVSAEEPRFIGRPISPSAPEDHGLALGVQEAYTSPPIQFRGNQHLHWPPQERQGNKMLVFDTEKEKFSWKNPPTPRAQYRRLLEFPDGKLGMSLSNENVPETELWRLDDYEEEDWVPVYRIRLPVMEPPFPPPEDFWMIPAVVSAEGDVLIECPYLLLHCNRNGNVLRQLRFPQGSLPVRHVLKESLVQHHPMFEVPKPAGATEPFFFNWLHRDPSW